MSDDKKFHFPVDGSFLSLDTPLDTGGFAGPAPAPQFPEQRIAGAAEAGNYSVTQGLPAQGVAGGHAAGHAGQEPLPGNTPSLQAFVTLTKPVPVVGAASPQEVQQADSGMPAAVEPLAAMPQAVPGPEEYAVPDLLAATQPAPEETADLLPEYRIAAAGISLEGPQTAPPQGADAPLPPHEAADESAISEEPPAIQEPFVNPTENSTPGMNQQEQYGSFAAPENAGQASAIPPKWGGAGTHGGNRDALHGPALSMNREAGGNDTYTGSPGMPAGGAWLWLPRGVEPRQSWVRRHPVLFWGGVILLLLLMFNAGRVSVQELPALGAKIAVINVEGVILDASGIVAWMEQVEKDDTFKGALLRINSPGGAVGPSQEIYAAAKRLQQKKPLVASMGALAASGGYYAALAADEIFAGPSTITASIGVKMQVPNVAGLMQTLGITEKTLATGPLKDAGSSWREMTPEEEAYLQSILEDLYDEFVTAVSRERELPIEQARALADGRAMTGRQAVKAGLVDRMGDKQEAVNALKKLCKLGEDASVSLVEGPEKPTRFMKDFLLSLFRLSLEERAELQQPVFFY